MPPLFSLWLPNAYVVAAGMALASALALFRRSVVLSVVLLVIATVSLATVVVEEPLQWAWTLLLIPVAMIVDHAAFVAMVRRMPFPDQSDTTHLPRADVSLPAAEAILRQSQAARDRYFGLDTLTLRYGLPALLLLVVGLAYTTLLCNSAPTCCGLSQHSELFLAARLGLAGAYVYVLLYLGQRAFRHDITSGAAMWSVATIALGPLLAVVCAMVLDPDVVTKANGAEQAGITKVALFFVAGLAPRHVAEFVEGTIRRILPASARATAAPARIVPLSQIRGIGEETEARLAEEGILDAHSLAMADPFKLLRSTNFDKRQILSWIDEAILISTLPDSWQKLEAVGITGATDLAAEGLAESSGELAAMPRVNELATEAGLTPMLLAQVIRRLLADMQVQIVWTLYQTPSESENGMTGVARLSGANARS